MNVLNMPIKSQVCTVNNKKDILDKKIKVKKSVLNFPFLQLLSNYFVASFCFGYCLSYQSIRFRS